MSHIGRICPRHRPKRNEPTERGYYERMNDNYKVYMHIFPNGKKYIGITKQSLKDRFDGGYGYRNSPMKDAIKKYGWENVCHELIIENLSKEEACKKEIELIEFYKTTDIRYGYNVSKGGEGPNGCIPSKETRDKMSKARLGIKLSKETKEKIGNSHRENLVGKKFGRLTVISYARKNDRVAWECVCDCGNHKIVRACHLVEGRISSCGCLAREIKIERNKSQKQRDILKKLMIGNKRRAKNEINID